MGQFLKLGKGFGECLRVDSRVQWLLRDIARNGGQKRGKSEGSGIPNSFKENGKGKRHSKKYKGSGIPDAKPV